MFVGRCALSFYLWLSYFFIDETCTSSYKVLLSYLSGSALRVLLINSAVVLFVGVVRCRFFSVVDFSFDRRYGYFVVESAVVLLAGRDA